MAFRIALKPTYWLPVEVWTPTDGGQFERSQFEVLVRRGTLDELNEWATLTTPEFLRVIAEDWRGLKDDDGADVPFSRSNLDRLLQIPQALEACAVAYWKSVHKAREKN